MVFEEDANRLDSVTTQYKFQQDSAIADFNLRVRFHMPNAAWDLYHQFLCE